MTTSRYVEHGAIVSGSAVFLLSRFLRSGPVLECMRGARWFGGPDVAEALHAIHAAGCAWETTVNVPQRDTAVRCEHSGADCATMLVEQAAERLGLGTRRVQDLARSGRITGRRVGRRWELDVRAVTIYKQQQQQKRAS